MYEKQRQLRHGSIYKLVPEEVIKEVWESYVIKKNAYIGVLFVGVNVRESEISSKNMY